MKEINIDRELQKLIPPLSDNEYSHLEKNIIADGCREKILVWDDVIVDGHNRYKICKDNDIEFKVDYIRFDDKNAAMQWMINHQFGRRNISNLDRAELALKLKPIIAARAEENRVSRRQNSDNEESIDTKKELATQAGVSHDTIAKVEIIKNNTSPDDMEQIRKDVRDNKTSINKKYKEIKAVERKQKQIEKENKSLSDSDKYDFVVTDNQDVIQCDALITDPPYGILDEDWDSMELEPFTRDWLKRWNECGADIFISSWSQRHLFDGKKWFDEELTNYTFQQLLIWHYPNNKSPQSRLGFKHTFEPIFMYRRNGSKKEIVVGGGEWGAGLNDFDCHVSAMPQSNFNDEKMKQHPAQKSVDVMRWLVNATSRKGDMVVDPFCGSGTTGVACMNLDRNFHGIEINKEYIEIAKKRILTYGV